MSLYVYIYIYIAYICAYITRIFVKTLCNVATKLDVTVHIHTYSC